MTKILNELFDDEAFDKILKWADSSINYTEKADKIDKLMKKYGLKPLDSGTNRICYTHKDYPKVVFKIGFDPQGILDNLNEYHKASLAEEFATCFELDKEGLILVEEKCPTIDYDFFQKKETKKKIRKMLEKLDEEGFVLLDLGLDKYKNYGVDKKGRLRIIDFGYVELKSIANFNCPHVRYKGDGEKPKYCKGHLQYNKNFTMLECDECENVFKIDVVLEGYTETKYKSSEKLPKYKPSKELDEFYKSFNKHRDRATLKQFVALSNKSNEKEGESNLSQDFLEKMKRLSGSVSSEEKNLSVPSDDVIEHQPSPQMEEILPRNSERKSLTVYHSTTRGIDILKSDEEVERERKYLNLSRAAEVINTDKSEESDRLVRDLFFARFPHVAAALDEIKERIEEDEDINTLCEESGIQIYKASNGNNEVHIAFQYENLQHDPWIVMSKGDTIIHINLKPHLEKIFEIDHDDETELIVTQMNVEPMTDFNGDYEEEYFGSDDNEEDSDD